MRAFPRNCGSRIVAGRVLTKIFAFEGMRPEREQRPAPTEPIELDQQAVVLGGPEECVGRVEARPARPSREGLEAQDRALLHPEDGLVGGHDPVAQQDVLEPFEDQQLLGPALVEGLGQGLLDRALHHPSRVQEGVVDGEAVTHLELGGGLDVGKGGPCEVGDQRRHHPRPGRAQVGHGHGNVAPALAVEEEQKPEPPGPVEAQDVAAR